MAITKVSKTFILGSSPSAPAISSQAQNYLLWCGAIPSTPARRSQVKIAGSSAEKIMYYVYLLQSLKDSKLYIGRTDNLINRLEEHNRGNVQSTKYRRQLELIYYEAYRNREDSKGRERGLKKSGSVYMALIKRIGLSREQRNGLHPASRD